jgi:hypothetical protein
VASYLLDTSVIIDALNNKRNRRGLLLDLLRQGHLLACWPINVAEVCAGLRPKEEAATEEFLRTLVLKQHAQDPPPTRANGADPETEYVVPLDEVASCAAERAGLRHLQNDLSTLHHIFAIARCGAARRGRLAI